MSVFLCLLYDALDNSIIACLTTEYPVFDLLTYYFFRISA